MDRGVGHLRSNISYESNFTENLVENPLPISDSTIEAEMIVGNPYAISNMHDGSLDDSFALRTPISITNI